MITQTELYLRLKTEIDTIPAIDTHVHINPAEPLARDLSQILYYHNYVSELVTAGAPTELGHPVSENGREKVMALIPEFKRSEYSSHAWMMREMLKTIYGFDEKLTMNNWESLYELVEKKRREPGRVKEVLRLAGVEKILIHLPPKPVSQCGCDESIFVGLNNLFIPVLPETTVIAEFEAITGYSIHTARQFADATLAYLKCGAEAGQRGLRISISAKTRLIRPGDAAVQAAFDRFATNATLSADDYSILETLALDATIAGAQAAGMVVQVFIEGSFFGDLRIPSSEQTLVATIHQLADSYPDVNFELYTISATLTQTLGLLAKYVNNIFLPGVWWLCQFPSIMESTYALRLEMLPSVKWSAFFSDAYEVEWIVGKALLTRKELTRSLALKVVHGYMTEEDAVTAARMALYDSPMKLYNIQ